MLCGGDLLNPRNIAINNPCLCCCEGYLLVGAQEMERRGREREREIDHRNWGGLPICFSMIIENKFP